MNKFNKTEKYVKEVLENNIGYLIFNTWYLFKLFKSS